MVLWCRVMHDLLAVVHQPLFNTFCVRLFPLKRLKRWVAVSGGTEAALFALMGSITIVRFR